MAAPKTPAEMLDALGKPFPRTAIKTRQGGGGKALAYVETHTVINRLNAATGGQWDFDITHLEWREDLLIALGKLTIPGLGARMGTGVQKIAERGGEDLVKGAASDSLKKAATLFGVGLELYGPDYEADAPAPPQRAPQRATRPPAAPKPAAKESDAIDLRDVLMEDMLARKTIAFLDATAQVWNYPGVADLPMDKLRDLCTLVYGDAPKKRQEAFDAWVFDWEHEHPVNQAELIPGTDTVPNPDRFTR